MSDEQLGYLTAKVEALFDKMEEYRANDVEAHKGIDVALKDIREQLSLYRHVVLTLKAIAWTLVFIVAFKFGDIKELWTALGK